MCRISFLLDRNRLGQVTREVDVDALRNGEPVRHQLERDDVEQALEDVDGAGHLDLVGLVAGELGVARVADDDRSALACDDLLVGVERLGEDVVTGKDHNNREGLVDEREDTVLEFAGHDGFAMEVGDFLDFQGACIQC